MELYKQTQTVTKLTFSIQLNFLWSQMTITCLKDTYRTASHTIKDTKTSEETYFMSTHLLEQTSQQLTGPLLRQVTSYKQIRFFFYQLVGLEGNCATSLLYI